MVPAAVVEKETLSCLPCHPGGSYVPSFLYFGCLPGFSALPTPSTVSCVLPSPAPVRIYIFIYLYACVYAAGTFPVNTNKQSSLYLYTGKETLPTCLCIPSWGRGWGSGAGAVLVYPPHSGDWFCRIKES